MNDVVPAADGSVEALRAEVARLRVSAAVQALRAGAAGHEAHLARSQVAALRASLFWRLTMPLRLAVDLARGAPAHGSPEAVLIRRALGVARRDGVGAAWQRSMAYLHRQRTISTAATVASPISAREKLPPAHQMLAPGVLIIAELSLQQCAKYRVWQKAGFFAQLGVPCQVVDWRDEQRARTAAAVASLVILYRVPGYPAMLRLIDDLRALNVAMAWEVDDLIFDHALFVQNRNIDALDAASREGVISGVDLYRAAMLATGAGIASTPHLADAMRAAGLREVAVVENALDAESLALAERLFNQRMTDSGWVTIGYGSGTRTHDADFRVAVPALLRLLAARPGVRLRIIGDLTLPDTFAAFAERVQCLPPAPYARYLALLAECDISLAPLEPSIFNDAKSNIKFLEAAMLGVASVCSPAAQFVAAIAPGVTAFLAGDDAAWFTALCALADDADLRTRMGRAARDAVLARYAPEAVARMQVAPLLARVPDERRRPALRILLANVYFAPRSYGGATLVAEELARHWQARGDTQVSVVTSLDMAAPDQVLTRGMQDGIQLFQIPVAGVDSVSEFDDPGKGDMFATILDAIQPDIVHLHSVQWLSASLAAACRARDIPYVITVHDAWWLCARQFMVRADGTYCFQTGIDINICQNCVPGAAHLPHRAALLKAALAGAALILSPSQSHRQLYLANGVPPERIAVSPNGVRLPAGPRATRKAGVLRFAYVGGNVDIKGYSIVKRAFEGLARADWRLVLVDNTLNLGFSSVKPADWSVRGAVEVVPAYTQDGLDDFFDSIDVLVFPSQWKESFGLTVREAMARDVWVIATEGGGPGEAIKDGVNGTLIALDGQPTSLLSALQNLLEKQAMFENYRNPYKADIIDCATQADSLWPTLKAIATAHG